MAAAAQTKHKPKMNAARARVEDERAGSYYRQLAAEAKPATSELQDALAQQRGQAQLHHRRLLLSMDDLRALGIPFSKSQLYKRIKDGAFPAPVKISEQRSAWVASEVYDWLEARMRDRAA